MHRQAIRPLSNPAHLGDVVEGQLRVNALGKEVKRQSDNIDVARALTIAEQRAFNSICSSEHTKLSSTHRCPAVIVRVQRNDHRVTILDGAAEPLDDVGIDIGRVVLHRSGQIQDHRVCWRGLDDVHHGFADFNGELRLSTRKGLRRVLKGDVHSAKVLRQFFDECGSLGGNLHDSRLVQTKHHSTLQCGGRVVEVNDDGLRSLDGLEGATDQILATVNQHLDGDTVRNQSFLNDLSNKVKVSLRSRRESHFDLFEPHIEEQLEHGHLALGVHGIDKRLIAVAQVNGAPTRSLLEDSIGPGAVVKAERHHGLVQLVGHRPGHLVLCSARHVCSLTRCSLEECHPHSPNKKPPAHRRRGLPGERSVALAPREAAGRWWSSLVPMLAGPRARSNPCPK